VQIVPQGMLYCSEIEIKKVEELTVNSWRIVIAIWKWHKILSAGVIF